MGVIVSGVLIGLGLLREIGPGGRPGLGSTSIRAGIAVLIGTPVLNVAMLGVGYAFRRQWRFAGTALGLLGLLALSVWLGGSR